MLLEWMMALKDLDAVNIQSPSEFQVCHGPGNILPKGDLNIYVFLCKFIFDHNHSKLSLNNSILKALFLMT